MDRRTCDRIHRIHDSGWQYVKPVVRIYLGLWIVWPDRLDIHTSRGAYRYCRAGLEVLADAPQAEVSQSMSRSSLSEVMDGSGPAQRWVLDLLHDPTVSLPDGATRADGALFVERSSTVRQALCRIRDDGQKGAISRDEAATRIVSVADFGLQAIPPEPALEPINADDVGVSCWMAVVPVQVEVTR